MTITVSPGVSGQYPVITLSVPSIVGDLVVPSLQDVTINNANDIFTYTQLNKTGKLSIATTSTNSISTNLVVEDLTFFGNASATTGSAAKLGVQGLSTNKTLSNVSITMGTKTISGQGYVTGLAPTVSADSPVWVTPVTITITGDFTVA
jgi:hypothetical protein